MRQITPILHRLRRLVHRAWPVAASLAIVLTACQPAATPVAAPPTAAPKPTQAPKPNWTAPLPGIQVFLWGSPATDRDLKLAKDAGFGFVKQMFQWNYIERDGKNEYRWDEPDRVVKAVQDNELKLMARLDFAPMWARPKGADPNLDGPPAKLEDWRDFVGNLAARYKGKIFAYQIWNEPNLARDWNGKPPSAKDYVDLLQVAYTAIKKVDPEALVITAGLSPTTASGAIAMPDEEFLRQMYATGAKPYFDLLGAHGAGYRSPPEVDPAVIAKDPALTNNDPSPEQKKRVYAFRHVEDLRQIMVDNGDEKKKVAILEFGWTSDSRPESPYRWHAVSEQEKATYIAGAFNYARDNWQSWIGPMSAIYISAPHWTPKDEQYYWSITDDKGGVRPAYDAVKKLFR